MFDVAIIGAGVVGGMIARELATYDLKICILEKKNDVAMGATKANSAIVHAGFDAKCGSLKARLNVEGSKKMAQVASELGVKYQNNGSLVIGFDEADREALQELLERGNRNGVEGLRLLEQAEVLAMEPNLSSAVTCALYAPTGAIICPYELTVAAIGNAMDNGAELKRNFKVTAIGQEDDHYTLFSSMDSVRARYIVNAAGVYSDQIAALAGDESFKITPRRGEYILLDKECGGLVKNSIFRTPSAKGKGILVSPTVDGNLLTGPTAVNIEDKTDKTTTAEGLAQVMKEAIENVPSIPYGKSITSFCGLRAAGDTGDFIINSPRPGFINAAGIESPGLSASPAIARMVKDLLAEQGLELNEKANYNPLRPAMHHFREASLEEKNAIIQKDPAYGQIICRCEGITEGEIRAAIRTEPKPMDLDGIKRRTRAQMGRCQGGFCSPLIMKILAEELHLPIEKITKSGGASRMIATAIKED